MGELHPKNPVLKRRYRRAGADWVVRASLVGANIPWLPTLAAKIYSEQGERELAIRHLEELYLTTQDPETQKQIHYKLRSLVVARDEQALREESERFKRAYEASPLRFVPADLFVLVDLGPLGPFDLKTYTSQIR